MFFSSPLIGLEFTDHAIRAVVARRSFLRRGKKKADATIQLQSEGKIPQHSLEQGIVKDREKCAEALDDVITNLHVPTHRKRAVLCLPASKVYTSILTLPSLPSGKMERDDLIRSTVADIIPEQSSDLTITSTVLHSSAKESVVGIAAVARTVLQVYLDLCKDAGVDILGVTTAPLVIAASLSEGENLFLLLQGGIKGGGEVTVTLFDSLWSIDEEVLPGESDNDTAINVINELLAEGKSRDHVIEKLFVHGGSAMLNALRDANFPDLLVEEAMPTLKLSEKKWAGPLAASALSPGAYVNLLRESTGSSHRWILISLALLGVFSLGVLLAVVVFS